MIDLQTLAADGHSDLFYGDESGFSLIPVVPYGWQLAGHLLERPSQASRRFNELAWLNQAGQLVSFASPVSINSAFVIPCVDEWVSSLIRPTVLVLANAPMPPVRRCGKIKYKRLATAAYARYETLTTCVKGILAEFGHQYTIQFAQNYCIINSV